MTQGITNLNTYTPQFANKKFNANKPVISPSFKGNVKAGLLDRGFDKADTIAEYVSRPFQRLFNTLANSKFMGKVVNNVYDLQSQKDAGKKLGFFKNLATYDSLKKHIGAWEGAWISGFYVLNTVKNKNIPEERKKPLVLNSIICGAVGIIASYKLIPPFVGLAKNITQKLKDKGVIPDSKKILAENAKKATKDTAAKISRGTILTEKRFSNGIKELALLAVITTMFRYVAPVAATPISTKLNAFFEKHKVYDKLGFGSKKTDKTEAPKEAKKEEEKPKTKTA